MLLTCRTSVRPRWCRCTSAVRDVAYSSSDKWAAVASDDLELRLVDTTNHANTKSILAEKDPSSSKSVSFDPKVTLQ